MCKLVGLELDLLYLSLHILIGEPQVDARGVDVFVPQLFLEGVQTSTTVEKVDCIPMAEEMGVDLPLELGATSRSLDDLIRSLLGDVTTLTRGEQIVVPPQA